MHRTRRMVFRRVQGGEVVEIGLDLGTVGHFEADRTEQRLDALQGASPDAGRPPSVRPARSRPGLLGQARLQGARRMASRRR